MRILYHHRTASKDGQAVHIEELIAALRAQGHVVRVVAPETGEVGRMGGGANWVGRLKDLLPKALYECLELGYSLLAYRKLIKAARDFRPDFIYERYNLFLLGGLLLKRKLGIPLVLEVNAPLVLERSSHSGGLALRSLARWAEGTVWRGADAVLPVTQVLGSYVAAYGVPPDRISVIPNGINKEHFAMAPRPEIAKATLGLQGKLVLGFTGFVRDWHAVDRVIDWMASPDAPQNTVLLVVGDGPARASLEQQAERLRLGDRVRFTGVIHRDRVPEHVAAFDIALQPAVTSYASPLKLMEYLMLGKAVLAPAEPNLLEILRDGENALMFDSKNPEGLSRSLAKLCRDASHRAVLAEGARRTIDRLDLTWNGNARRIVELARAAMQRS